MTTWVNMEGIMLSEISQTQKDKYCIISSTCGIKNSQTHRCRGRRVVARGEGSMGGDGLMLVKRNKVSVMQHE